GALTQRELAGELKVSDAEVTHLVEALYKKNFAARKRRARDRRYILINLTSFGKWFMGHAEPSAVRIMARKLEPLAAEEQEELIRLCSEIERERGEMEEEKEIDIERDYD
ncbi:MAG: MarR family transcriptional regulator, partial [Candidatus Hodarchaeales archaeon]